MVNPANPLSPAKILVAHDNIGFRRRCVLSLQSAGFDVTEASSGADVFRLLGSLSFRILVLSLDFGNSDAFQVLKFVKREHPGVHVLAISDESRGRLLEAAEFLGATAGLANNEVRQRLATTIRKLLGTAD